MTNKYVDFVSDEDFLECVKNVCDAYPEDISVIDMKKLHKNTLDPIKQMFDISAGELNEENWLKKENFRQVDKTVTNRIGDFHQCLLGKVKGWNDLGRGHPLGLDLEKEDGTIFVELKNKHNTVKGEDQKHVYDKLKRALDENPNSKIYYAYILPKKPTHGEKLWKPSQREENPNIYEAWGKRVYEIVTNDINSLEKTWKALPIAINDLRDSEFKLTEEEISSLENYFKLSLG